MSSSITRAQADGHKMCQQKKLLCIPSEDPKISHLHALMAHTPANNDNQKTKLVQHAESINLTDDVTQKKNCHSHDEFLDKIVLFANKLCIPIPISFNFSHGLIIAGSGYWLPVKNIFHSDSFNCSK